MMSCDFFLLENFFQRKNWFFILTCFIVIFRSNWRMSLELIVFWIHCTGNLFRNRFLHLSLNAIRDRFSILPQLVLNGTKVPPTPKKHDGLKDMLSFHKLIKQVPRPLFFTFITLFTNFTHSKPLKTIKV